jgi:hydroxypyruvate reductase
LTDLPFLRRAARDIFKEALDNADAGEAVRRAVHLEETRLTLPDATLDPASHPTGIYSVALGKAARPMASALGEILGEQLTAGVVAAPPATQAHSSSLSESWQVFEGGHPLPNRASLEAGRAALELLRRAERERAPVVFLISGGGSALMEWPRSQETTLEELRAMHGALVACGADIAEINCVRRAVSAIKGGGLARLAPHCDQVTLIVSDTNAGEAQIVASGPTFDYPVDASEAESIVARYNLHEMLPESIIRTIRQPFEIGGAPSAHRLREHYVLLENAGALISAERAARRLGFTTEIAREAVEQEVSEGCSMLLSKLLNASRRTSGARRGVCLISGGEFACPVSGHGVGGRNCESTLRWAVGLDALGADARGFSHAVALSAGTDGVDGNSPAAGAICDETTIERARQLKLDADSFLNESDAYTFFRALDDAIITGPTGTNVRDLRIMLAS